MNIIVTGRHLDVTPALRSYAEEKIKKVGKYFNNVTEVIITLGVEKYRHKAEVQLRVNGVLIQAEEVTGEMYSSIDKVMDKIERQVKKFKEKLTWHKGRTEGEKETPSSETTLKEEGYPQIIRRKKFATKPMSPEEAVLQMELLDKDFFIFENDSTGDINVIYRRRDGNVGLIEPVRG
ncbi:MAG: ribosome-associated translation inhibitor RaiA [Nitrospirota bacterium]